MRVFFLQLSLLISIPFTLFSQETSMGIDPEKPLHALSMDQWTGRDGLVSNNLTSVNQSSSKFIWITSFNGVLRFDGINFKLFDKTNLPFLSSNGFYLSYEDSKGNLWFASQSSGIIKYKNNQFQQILEKDHNSLSVRCIKEDNEGNIWVGTNNEGVYILKDTLFTKIDREEFNYSHIMDIEVDIDGRIWFATNGNGIFILNDDKIEQLTKETGLNHNTVNKLMLGRDGRMYAGTLDGVFYYKDGTSGRLKLLDGLEVNDICIDDYNNFWVGSEQGLYRVNLTTNIFDHFTEENGLPASQISSICFDHENSLWLSTKKAGLLRFRDGFFKNITTKDGLTSNNVNIIVEHKGKFFVGCDDGLINVVEGNSVNRFKVQSTFYNVGIRDINFSLNGEILIASYRGLLVVKDGKEQLIDLTAYGASNDIRRILRTKEGAIWMATRSSGVIKHMDSEHVEIYNSTNGLMADYILALEEHENGDIYVGTHSGGLSIIKKNNEIVNYPIEEGKSGILIFNLQIMEDNSVWIATNIGIYKFENEQFKKVLLDDNLKAETIFDIILENNNAWLSSNIGLIKVTREDLNSFLDGDVSEVTGRLFDRFDGMASQECTGATRLTLSQDGYLWIPTLGGVAVLDPNNIKLNENAPEVYITDFRTDINERKLSTDDFLSIEPGVLRYEFDFTSLSYIAPPKVLFKYKLSGIDQNWVEAGTEREAIYTNLPKGNYTFTVLGSNNDGIWNKQGATIRFKVEPYFYETTIFYVLVVAVIGIMIWGIFVWRVHNIERVNNELRKLNEELDRFVYSASHDLRAPLSSVRGLVEIARLEPTIKGKDECLIMINESIQKLDGFINDIIDYSRNQRIQLQTDKVDIETEVNEVFNELKFLDKLGQIKISVFNHAKRHFITDGRRLSIILKNLISNSIRYHDLKKDDPFIHVEIKYNSHAAIISVTDNGIGIDKAHLKHIFKMFYRADEGSKGSGLGLYIVKETLDKLKGDIEVKSILHEGTTFTVTIPSLKPVT